MDKKRLIKFGGYALILSGILVAAGYVLHPPSTDNMAGDRWFWVHFLLLLALIAAQFGLMALYARQVEESGTAGFLGFVLGFVGLTLILGLDYFESFLIPVFASQIPGFAGQFGAGEGVGLVRLVFPLSGGLFIVGFCLLAIGIIRAGILPAWTAWLTMAGVVLFGLGMSGYLPHIVGQAGAALFGTAIIVLGVFLVRE